jgi:hypothetical protein
VKAQRARFVDRPWLRGEDLTDNSWLRVGEMDAHEWRQSRQAHL